MIQEPLVVLETTGLGQPVAGHTQGLASFKIALEIETIAKMLAEHSIHAISMAQVGCEFTVQATVVYWMDSL
jgi:hypothetical protein